MKLNFRKIASVLASAVMIGSTVGTALAANYPTPFVVGGKADAAIVVTSGTHLGASSDLFAALDLQKALQGQVTTSSGTTVPGSVSGEAAPLFTGSSKIYLNNSLNTVKNVVTKTEMPTTLADGSFSGNVDATYTQTVYLGSNPQVTFAKQPSSSNDPQFGLAMSTNTAQYIYNATVNFNKAVNLASTDSKNQQLTLFGQQFTIGSATTASSLVLLKQATKVDLDSTGKTSADVTIGGKDYTVDLVSATTDSTSATVSVTDKAAGTSDSKTVSVGSTKKINGLTIAISTAGANTQKYFATVVAGAEKYTFADGGAVTFGDQDTVIDGTYVRFTNTTGTVGVDSLTKIVVSVVAKDSETDAIIPGSTFVDPVFGTFGVNFAGLNVPENASSRETIKVYNSGDDKMFIDFTSNQGVEKAFQFAINQSTVGGDIKLSWDTDGHQIAVQEGTLLNKSDYVVVGNENEGRLIKVATITNQTAGYSSDKVSFTDVFTGDTYDATLTGEGTGTVLIGGKVYTVNYYGDQTLSNGPAMTVRLNYPDSSSATDMILYPSISTAAGNKVFFYKPLNFMANASWDATGDTLSNGNIKLPSFDNSYATVAIVNGSLGGQNMTIGGQGVNSSIGYSSYLKTITNTGLTYNFTGNAMNNFTVYLVDPKNKANILEPAVIVMEQKDDKSQYQGMIVNIEGAGTSDNGLGVSSVIRTWDPLETLTNNAGISLSSNSKIKKLVDSFGTVATIDQTDSDQNIASLSIPNEQLYAQLYVAATGASIMPGQSAGATGGGVIQVVKDSDVATVGGSNLIVVGGSCINTVAAKLLGSTVPLCGADFTAKTKVGASQYIIESFTSPYNSGKVAVLVAGYEASQTVDAVNALKGGVATDVGQTKIGPTAV